MLRRRLTRVLLLCLVLVALWAAVSARRDFFLFYWRHDSVIRDTAGLAQALQGSGLDFQQVGSVRYGGDPLPLWALRKPASSPRAPTACLLAGVHGNEPAGVQALLSLAARLHERAAAYDGVRFVLVPLANPWGWERDLRHNGANDDIARHFVSGDAQEAALLKSLFSAEHCDLFVDLHEDRTRDGFYLLAYAAAARTEIGNIVRSIEADSGVRHARVGDRGLITVSETELHDVGLTTASLWARLNGTRNAFIVETSEALPLEQRIALHLMAIDRLARLLPAR